MNRPGWPAHPVVHEVNTWVWLGERARRAGRPVTLGDVPAEAWDAVARPGVEAVWLMGVWQRSERGAAIARADPVMRPVYAAALPDVTHADIVGSAYCIRNYTVDPHLGGDEGLAVARQALAARGVRLVLDFVPNHVAPDHPWIRDHPEYGIAGTAEDQARDPASFISVGGHVLACGRDPYFPAWSDVVQLDTSRADVRAAATAVVEQIAERCDGVRCDMAMLVLDDVFTRTWGERARGGPTPDEGRGYWPTLIEGVRRHHPGFAFWAEAYWDLEPVLVAQGFDACYDKRLYDRLVHREPAASVRAHLQADPDYQGRTVRFVENHDEPRLASVLDPATARMAAVIALTLPGVALVHEGQADGRRVHVPVALARRPAETLDADLHRWYDRLLDVLAGDLRTGQWALVGVEGWPDNRSCEQLLAWTWTPADDAPGHLVVANLSRGRADGLIRLPDVGGDSSVVLHDRLSGARYERDAGQLRGEGLYVALDPAGVHLLTYPRAGA